MSEKEVQEESQQRLQRSGHLRLLRVFNENFTAIDIASPLLSFDADSNTEKVLRVLEEKGLDAAGVRLDGAIAGYVLRDELSGGTCEDFLHSFDNEATLEASAGMPEVIKALENRERLFLTIFGVVAGLLRKMDLEKPAARMWLFGMISLIEMSVTEAIKKHFKDDSWQALVSPARLSKAQALFEERRQSNVPCDLISCLQLIDKGTVFMKDLKLRSTTVYESRRSGEKDVKRLVRLRNHLAHSHPLMPDNWQAIEILANRFDNILSNVYNMDERLKAIEGDK
ncbi:MAG: hypothetical protein ACYSSP_02325 [Planctomycetota bacterium]|jgi:hypothetical protein